MGHLRNVGRSGRRPGFPGRAGAATPTLSTAPQSRAANPLTARLHPPQLGSSASGATVVPRRNLGRAAQPGRRGARREGNTRLADMGAPPVLRGRPARCRDHPGHRGGVVVAACASRGRCETRGHGALDPADAGLWIVQNGEVGTTPVMARPTPRWAPRSPRWAPASPCRPTRAAAASGCGPPCLTGFPAGSGDHRRSGSGRAWSPSGSRCPRHRGQQHGPGQGRGRAARRHGETRPRLPGGAVRRRGRGQRRPPP